MGVNVKIGNRTIALPQGVAGDEGKIRGYLGKDGEGRKACSAAEIDKLFARPDAEPGVRIGDVTLEDLPGFIADQGIAQVQAWAVEDDRKGAAPIYKARIEELTPSPADNGQEG